MDISTKITAKIQFGPRFEESQMIPDCCQKHGDVGVNNQSGAEIKLAGVVSQKSNNGPKNDHIFSNTIKR